MDYCSINTVLEGADYRNAEEWPVIAEFQAKALKELADFVFYPYEQELREIAKQV